MVFVHVFPRVLTIQVLYSFLCYIAKKAEFKKSLVHEKGEDIRIVLKEQEFLTSQILFNNLAQLFFFFWRRIRNIYSALLTRKNTRIIHSHSHQWMEREGGGGWRGYFILLRWDGFMEKKLENRWNWYSSFRCYDVLELIFDRERPTRISFPFPHHKQYNFPWIHSTETTQMPQQLRKMTAEPREAIWKLAFNPKQSFGVNRRASSCRMAS